MKEQENRQAEREDSPSQEKSEVEIKIGESKLVDSERSIDKEKRSEYQEKIDQRNILKNSFNKRQSVKPNAIISKCLEESFSNVKDIVNFCSRHFESLCKELKEEDRFYTVIMLLIQHCNKHNSIDTLWECVKLERVRKYEIFYPQWQSVMRSQDLFCQFNDSPKSTDHQNRIAPADEVKAHPLSENNSAAINEWFFNELDPKERSMVLTVALFEGINRKHMVSISNGIQSRLF